MTFSYIFILHVSQPKKERIKQIITYARPHIRGCYFCSTQPRFPFDRFFTKPVQQDSKCTWWTKVEGKDERTQERTDGWTNEGVQADREVNITKLTFIFLNIANVSKAEQFQPPSIRHKARVRNVILSYLKM